MKALGIPYHHPEGYLRLTLISLQKVRLIKNPHALYHHQMKALDTAGQIVHQTYLIKISMKL